MSVVADHDRAEQPARDAGVLGGPGGLLRRTEKRQHRRRRCVERTTAVVAGVVPRPGQPRRRPQGDGVVDPLGRQLDDVVLESRPRLVDSSGAHWATGRIDSSSTIEAAGVSTASRTVSATVSGAM